MDRQRIAKNIIDNYGVDMFKYLVSSLKQGVSGTEIGEEFGVTRQRVSQWRKALVLETRTQHEFCSFAGTGLYTRE